MLPNEDLFIYCIMSFIFADTSILFAEASGPYETILKAFLYTTRKYKTLQNPSPLWLDKIICEHLYEFVITIIVLLRHAVYTVSLSLLSVHHYFVCSFCITEL